MPDMIVATKEMIEELFDGAAERYDREGPRVFEKFGAHLIEWINLQPGMRVLDAATGKGAVLVPAAQRVGANGHVIGIDLSNEMIVQTAHLARELGLSNVETRKMDAEQLEFADESFDCVTCAFSLFFFPSMNVALTEMRRVLKKDGRIGIALFGGAPAPFTPAWGIFAEQARAYGIAVRTPQKVVYSAEDVLSLLSQAGFGNTQIQSETYDIVYTNVEDWWAFQFTLGNRAALLRMSDETRAQFKEEYLAKLRPLFRDDGLHLGVNVVYACAQQITQAH
jgi:ubiquinone/menaquinone biosynthesis C-methylase UbiE